MSIINTINRRKFLSKTSLLAGALFCTKKGWANVLEGNKRFCIAGSTHQVHFYATGNQRGQAKAYAFVQEQGNALQNIRLDTGNFVRHLADVEPQIAILNASGFQAVAIGPNEFALGEKALVELAKRSHFSLINTHYNWQNADLKQLIKPYEIIQVGDKRIGIIALGTPHACAVTNSLMLRINQVANQLKEKLACASVICLVPPILNKADLMEFVQQSQAIDLIFSSSMADFKAGNRVLKNAKKQDVLFLCGQCDGQVVAKSIINIAISDLVLPDVLNIKHIGV